MNLKRNHYYLAAAIVGVAVVGVFFGRSFFSATVAAEHVPVVRTKQVAQQNSAENYAYSGEVRGRYETQLGFQVGGKILRRNVELGSRVQAGDVLMTIDGKDLQQGVNQYDAQVFSAQAQQELAAANLQRYEQLYKNGAVSKAEYDRYRTSYDTSVASVRQAAAQYNQGANQLDYSVLRADSSGVIASLDAEIGQVVSQGQKVLTLVRDGEKEVEINVPENRVEELRTAKACKVTFWALKDVTLAGQVREISPIADKVSRTFKVRITLVNPPEQLKYGMTATVTLDGGNEAGSVELPLAAIYQNNGTPQVWVVENNQVALRTVKIRAFGNDQVQVIEGLKNGDLVVTAGVHKLWEGQQVKTGGGGL